MIPTQQATPDALAESPPPTAATGSPAPPTTTADPVADLFRLTDLATPHAVRVAATLRLPDALAGGPVDLTTLARRVSAAPDSLARLVRHLVGRGLFVEPTPGTVANGPAAELLRSDHPAGLREWFDLDGGMAQLDRALAGMRESVLTGEASYPSMFGRPFWEDLASKPAMAEQFDQVASTQAKAIFADVAAGYDWTATRHVVDVAGGDGSQLVEILRASPETVGTLLETAPTVRSAARRLAAAGLADRVTLLVHDLRAAFPVAAADVYLLVRLLHNWNDDDARILLTNCARAAGPGGRVLLVERPVDDPVAGPYPRSAVDLLMLVGLGGRERTLGEMHGLATAAGLTCRQVSPLPSGWSLLEYEVVGVPDDDALLTRVRDDVTEILDEELTPVGDHDDLAELGMDSIRMMQLAEWWRPLREDVSFVDLARQPTIASWAKLLGGAS